MKILTDKAMREWLNERHMYLGHSGHLSCKDAEQMIEVPLYSPATREAVTALAVNMVGLLDTGSGWLLWIRDFSIWSDDTDELGWNMIDAFAQIARQPKLDIDSSAMLFEPDEMLLLKTILVVPILFVWDAYLVNGDGNTFVRLDHDDHNSISTKQPSVVQEIQESQIRPWIVS